MQKPVAEVSVLYSAKSARLYVMKEKLQQHKKKILLVERWLLDSPK